MNGDWEKRLTELEVITKERWDNHDSRSDEQWTYIRGMLFDITKRMQCESHASTLKALNSKVNWLYGILGGVIVSTLVIELATLIK